VFFLIANLVGTTGADALQSVIKMVATQWTAYAVILLVLHPLIMLLIVKVTPFSYWRKMAPAMITGFAIQSSSGTLPVTLSSAKKLGVKDDSAEVILPIAATINMQAVAAEMPIYVLWVAQMYGLELSFMSILIAIFLGVFGAAACAGVPGGGILIATITLTTLGMPLTAVGWIAGIYIFIDILNTMTNVTSDPLGVMVVNKWLGEFNKDEYYAKESA
jgi:Na+/H+-dicarboxylate symporter